MVLLDLSHTSHTRARTGVQRVTLSLWRALGAHGRAVTWDPYARTWRDVATWERANLEATTPDKRRGATWPMRAKVGGFIRRRKTVSTSAVSGKIPATGALVPEIFSAAVARHLHALPQPRIAVFHDAIAMKLPELSPPKTVARFPAYLQELLNFEGIAAVSEDSAKALAEYWDWLGVQKPPSLRVIPLGVDVPQGLVTGKTRPGLDASPDPIVLCVGSIEGRKNHVALLNACEQLWAAGAQFELHLVGIARPETATAALARMDELKSKGRLIRHDRNADDVALTRAYQAAAFTVYPSLMEGFGLPVLESVAHGKPCICASAGALGEAARGGGCLLVPHVDPDSLARAIGELLTDRAKRGRLETEARARKLRSWAEYANDLLGWVDELRGGR